MSGGLLGQVVLALLTGGALTKVLSWLLDRRRTRADIDVSVSAAWRDLAAERKRELDDCRAQLRRDNS